MTEIDRREYDSSFGPTTGDRIRLADTNLFIEVTDHKCVGGDEAVFGGGKSIRESMGQSMATRADGTPDLVITGAPTSGSATDGSAGSASLGTPRRWTASTRPL